jgi:amide synthase
MFGVEEYLLRIGYRGKVGATTDALRELHKRHLMTIAFDNVRRADRGKQILNDADIDIDKTFDRIVRGGEGGVCFELCGLFTRLLRELGFIVNLFGAGVRGADGMYGPDLEHMFSAVEIDGVRWLADVGYAGLSFLEPLRLSDEVQFQYGCQYRLVPEEGYHVLCSRSRDGDWKTIFRFRPDSRDIAEWRTAAPEPDNANWNWEGQNLQAGTKVRSRAFETGKMVLIGRRYLRIEDGNEETRVLVKPADYQNVVDQILVIAG